MNQCTYNTQGGFKCGSVPISDPYPEPCSSGELVPNPASERNKLEGDRSIFNYYVSPLLLTSAIQNTDYLLLDPEKKVVSSCMPFHERE